MPGLTVAAAGSDWTYGGSVLTFVFPMILFLIVGAVLLVLFTKPQVVPGRERIGARSVATTRVAGQAAPAVGQTAAVQAADPGGDQAASAEQAAGAEGSQ